MHERMLPCWVGVGDNARSTYMQSSCVGLDQSGLFLQKARCALLFYNSAAGYPAHRAATAHDIAPPVSPRYPRYTPPHANPQSQMPLDTHTAPFTVTIPSDVSPSGPSNQSPPPTPTDPLPQLPPAALTPTAAPLGATGATHEPTLRLAAQGAATAATAAAMPPRPPPSLAGPSPRASGPWPTCSLLRLYLLPLALAGAVCQQQCSPFKASGPLQTMHQHRR